MKTVLEIIYDGSIGDSSGRVRSGGLVDWILLLVCFMWPLEVSMDVVGLCVNSRVLLVHVLNYPFFMACSRVWW